MVRRYTTCDNCGNKCNIGNCGNSISIWIPFGHKLDGSHGRELDTPHEFCSDACLINYLQKGGDINECNIPME